MEHVKRDSHKESSVIYFFEIAEEIFNLDFDKQTRERWYQLIYLAKELDAEIDVNSTIFDDIAKKEIISHYLNDEYLSTNYPSLQPNNDPERYEALLALAGDIFDLNQQLRTTTYPGEYTALRQQEGRKFAQLLIESTSSDVREQSGFKEFERTFTLMGESGILVDSFIDIKKDYQYGEVAARFSFKQRMGLLIQAVTVAKELPLHKLNLKAIGVLGATAIHVAHEGIRGRG